MSIEIPTEDWIRAQFGDRNIVVLGLDSRTFPGEIHHVVYVDPADLQTALTLASGLKMPPSVGDSEFVIVRRAPNELLNQSSTSAATGPIKSLHDDRCYSLINLVSARSRVSSSQPSLSYVPDARANLAAVTAARHDLIFGRRGAGKTALLVEARRQLDVQGAVTAWVNVQTLRRESAQRVVLYALDRVLSALISSKSLDDRSAAAVAVGGVASRIQALLAAEATEESKVQDLVPRVQRALQDYLELAGRSLFIFMDDYYYLPRARQPEVLDILHGCTRDTNAWLKVASIKHLTKWWQASPPVGLQSGQDADLIDLDISLQDPGQAKDFLEGVLLGFAKSVGIPSLSRLFRPDALDRLVVAAGAVPRDYLVLATSAISRAQRRPNARLVGVQEVNQAAGDAAASKIQELEEDMASNAGTAEVTLATLKAVRAFCIDDHSYTYFLVDFRDRENHPSAYNLLTDLMDVRLIHLVDPGVSNPHSAGDRSEAFMLDLSQFSGSRLKQKLRVLDFSTGHFVSRVTRSKEAPRIARTAREFITILRAAPQLDLDRLQQQVSPREIQVSRAGTS